MIFLPLLRQYLRSWAPKTFYQNIAGLQTGSRYRKHCPSPDGWCRSNNRNYVFCMWFIEIGIPCKFEEEVWDTFELELLIVRSCSNGLLALENFMDLFSLPIEILEQIFKHLQLNDLLSCSMVCKEWRSGINQDFIWRRKCLENKYEPDLIEISTTHKFIDDYETDNEENGDSLEPPGYWRKIYNWYSALAFNWLNGNFINYKLSITQSPVYCLDCDGQTIATGHEDANIYVWSVTTVPFHLTTMQCLLSDYPILSIRIINNIIIAQQKKLLQVYYNEDGKYKFIDAKSFEVGENHIEQMSRIELLGREYENWYKECLRMNEVYSNSNKGLVYNLCDRTLFASNNHSGFLFSWKLPDNELFSCYEVHQDNISQIECVRGEVYLTVGIDVTHLLILDKMTDSLKILLSVPGTKRFIIGQDLILAVPLPGDNYLKRLWVWNKNDEYESPRIRDVICTQHSAFIALHKFIVYSENSQVKVWDPNQDILVSKISVGTPIDFIKNCFSTVLIVFVNSNLYLWNWKTGVQICCLNNSSEWIGDFRRLVWISPTMLISGGCSKQLQIFSFW